ncbi:MAG: homocysteine S-methyltransferase family protein [Candidatus Aminicenantes bacterium]|nr:homocysteine S-methyltransferase family protein [Candidatus Aminicenantes bacterium]
MKSNILDLITERIVLLDGGMGTELIKNGLPSGACPELWNVENPEIIKNIHSNYFKAGSDAVLTNSFGGNSIKLSAYNLEKRCYELNFEAARIANEVRTNGKFVGGSIGPTGKFLKPTGNFTEEEFEESFTKQAKALSDGKVDFILIETQYDIKEALCAFRASKRVSSVPVFVTMTFNIYPKGYFTIMGNSVEQCIEEFKANEIPVLGANCTLNSKDMVNLIKTMRQATSLPLIAQANAGQPLLGSNGRVKYTQTVEEYVKHVPEIIRNGANIIGGCCGTDPEYIRQMARIIKNYNN